MKEVFDNMNTHLFMPCGQLIFYISCFTNSATWAIGTGGTKIKCEKLIIDYPSFKKNIKYTFDYPITSVIIYSPVCLCRFLKKKYLQGTQVMIECSCLMWNRQLVCYVKYSYITSSTTNFSFSLSFLFCCKLLYSWFKRKTIPIFGGKS